MTEKRCRNCDAYDKRDKFCYLKMNHMDTLEYCSEFRKRY